ncbi:MAG: cob(I)yrinic acid a,c-diamide adenosyltransferase [Planctomycetota bacterium]
MNTGHRILLFTGDGKGKTTAAVGLGLRACGHGMRVKMFQFIKARGDTGEIAAVETLPNFDVEQVGRGFVRGTEGKEFSRHRRAAREGLEEVKSALQCGEYDVVIMDEVCVAVAKGLLDEEAVMDVLPEGEDNGERIVVMTGRGATDGLIQLADTVTEMRCVKHALQEGREALKGVEL